MKKMATFCEKYDVVYKHTSGHATPEIIAKVIEAIDPKEAIIHIHTEHPEKIKDLKIREELKMRVELI